MALALCVGVMAVSVSTAVAQSVGDIEERDQLIANQENLLNAYRCLFSVDVEQVPGGCPNPEPVSPGAAPLNPTQQDLVVRDQLVVAQEALLNTYRCLYAIDTQMVTGGCDAAPTPTPTAPPSSDFESMAQAAFARYNQSRQVLGLNAFKLAVEGDDSFIPIQDVAVGCYEPLESLAELTGADIQAISFYPWTQGTECALGVVTYHIVPRGQRMRVERAVWECFTQSRDIREPSDVSCGGRFTAFGRQVKWLPDQVSYTIVEGRDRLSKFTSLIPWINEKLGIQVEEAASAESANLFLHLGVPNPPGCFESYGCNIWEEGEAGASATIYISAPDEFHDQVLKHELLHALIPMGHLPQGNFLMSVRPTDPSQTHTLTALENSLLKLYTNPYLRADMTMEQFRRYLVIVG